MPAKMFTRTIRKDGLEVRTLPLDDALQPKGVYDAIGAALDGAPSRSP